MAVELAIGRRVYNDDGRAVEIAYHEAGHAVALWLAGAPLGWVTIRPGTSPHRRREAIRVAYRGAVHVATTKPCARRRALWVADWSWLWHGKLVPVLAGPEAQRRLTGQDDPAGWRLDHEKAKELVRRWGGAEEVFSWAEAEAREWVRRPDVWGAVEALAARLLERGRLTGKAAEAVVSEAWASRREAA